MKSKKWLMVVLSVMLSVAVAGCGAEESAASEVTAPVVTEAVASEVAVPDSEGEDYIPVMYTDVPEDSPYYDVIYWSFVNNITVGTVDGLFLPDEACNRESAMRILWNACCRPMPDSQSISMTDINGLDVDSVQAILWALSQGISAGTSETTFSPQDAVSRGQAILFMWRSAGSPEVEVEALPFADISEDSPYYQAICWAYAMEVTASVSGDSFKPDETCTRADYVRFVYDYIGE